MNSKQFAGLSWPDEEAEKLIVQKLIEQKVSYYQWNIGALLAKVIGERNAAMGAVRTYMEVIEDNKVDNERVLKSHQVKATYTKAEVIRELNNQLVQIVEEVARRLSESDCGVDWSRAFQLKDLAAEIRGEEAITEQFDIAAKKLAEKEKKARGGQA